MVELQRGGNAPVGDGPVTVRIDWAGPAGVEADISAYLLGESGRVSGDHDMIFYNQPSGAGGAIAMAAEAGSTRFTIDPDRLPPSVARIAFCLTIDGGQTFAALTRADLTVCGDIAFAVPRAGASEAAMILGELYRRGGAWKFRAVGQGFDGGLGPLARSFGIDVDDEPPAPRSLPPPADTVSLEKIVAAKAPQLVDLAKTAAVSLEKKQLGGVRAQVVLVLDATGSMTQRYRKGVVQAVVDRILPLAVHFDDDGALDVCAYAQKPGRLTDITLDNVADYILREGGGWEAWPLGARYNDEPAVLKPLIEAYSVTKVPTYVVFISDGGVSANRKIEALLRDAAGQSIFWQFVGIGGRNYGVFEKLDDMPGRVVDNCNFFALDDLADVSDSDLYDRLLDEFPSWLNAARRAGILA